MPHSLGFFLGIHNTGLQAKPMQSCPRPQLRGPSISVTLIAVGSTCRSMAVPVMPEGYSPQDPPSGFLPGKLWALVMGICQDFPEMLPLLDPKAPEVSPLHCPGAIRASDWGPGPWGARGNGDVRAQRCRNWE